MRNRSRVDEDDDGDDDDDDDNDDRDHSADGLLTHREGAQKRPVIMDLTSIWESFSNDFGVHK